MEMLTTKSELEETIEDLLSIELIARDNYIKDLAIFNNPKITSIIEKIKKDEDIHIAILKEIKAMLESE
jgi:hypothetical protein